VDKKKELIEYRISRSKETFEEAKLMAHNNHYNACANRLYYACFYIVNALLIKFNLSFNTHNGLKTSFHQSFIRSGLIKNELGKLYSRVFNLRQEGDYADFRRYQKSEIFPFINEVEIFIRELEIFIRREK
jgi:uncharacterized protein (UPF0332 family)